MAETKAGAKNHDMPRLEERESSLLLFVLLAANNFPDSYLTASIKSIQAPG